MKISKYLNHQGLEKKTLGNLISLQLLNISRGKKSCTQSNNFTTIGLQKAETKSK